MRDDFSTLDICKALNIPRERLRSWMKEGFIEPNEPSEGQGKRAIFTRQGVYKIAIFKSYIERGFDRKTAADCASIAETFRPKEQIEFLLFLHAHSPAIKLIKKGIDEKVIIPPSLIDLATWDRIGGYGFRDFKDLIDLLKQYEKTPKGVLGIESIEFIDICNFGSIKRRVDVLLSSLE